jgi:hypothetical protein
MRRVWSGFVRQQRPHVKVARQIQASNIAGSVALEKGKSPLDDAADYTTGQEKHRNSFFPPRTAAQLR